MIPDFLKPTLTVDSTYSKPNGLISVKKSWGLGTYIEVGGLTQSGGVLNIIWKSTLNNLKKRFYFPQKPAVLILGLGGGTAAKWINCYWPEAAITGVDIDSVMPRLGCKYLELKKIKLKIVINDALSYLKRTHNNQKFDLIIVDLYCGSTFPGKFTSSRFLNSVKNCLNNKGIVVFNRLFYKEKKELASTFEKILTKTYSKIVVYKPEANIMFFCRKY